VESENQSMPSIRSIIGFLDDLLDPREFEDYGPNGLQVPGKERIATIATGVSASVQLFERAAALGADLVLVHHGLFWGRGPGPIDPLLHRRLKVLYAHDMALAAYHLPLDGHLEHGNNALLAQELGASELSSAFGGIGVTARFPGDGIAPGELRDRVRAATGGREPLAFLDGPERVSTVGVVSGAAASSLPEAIALGLDAYVTGEPAERVMNEAREAQIHFLAAGHYATETFGVRRLGELLEARFDLRHTFVDVPNPI
jgi:dinuclear metal center YbgI/SA1388 family protein